MRLTNIEIKNFRAFPKSYQIDLYNAGKNLLVYGENGSGKSSLYLALKYFFESGVDADKEENKNTEFENHQNIFTEDPGYVKLCFRSESRLEKDTYEWSRDTKETTDELIIEVSKAKGFLDYKSLLETHYIHRESETVNLFNLLVKTLLADTANPLTNRTLADDWSEIQPPYPRRRDAKNKIADLERRIVNFNRELANRLTELTPKVSEILEKFGYNIEPNFDFQGVTYNQNKKELENQEILLEVDFFNENIRSHHLFLNEAKLSAIAISVYLSSILLLPDPKSGLRILALDDVLIGLDMSNRFPVLDILEEYFKDYQIFLTTYDKAWYEIAKQRTDQKDWKYTEFYFKATTEYEIPVCKEDIPYLGKAREYLDANDYKACAIYVRTAFEEIIKRFCDKRNLKVRYCENPKELTTKDFWEVITTQEKRSPIYPEQNILLLDQKLVDEIESAQKFILNELSHATFVNIYRKELEDAIDAVEQLEAALA
ncbi:MAG: AAA family ATPase [Candidatus Poribacteria bacterium]|nr:AAA family ATPase [Candidatus Poribacteria bacterium]